jgi:hypothetical protein
MELSQIQKKELIINTLRSESNLIVNKLLIQKIGLMPAILLSNYLEKQFYFEKTHSENDGWFFQKHSQIIKQLCFSEYDVKKTKKILVAKRLLQIQRKGLPSKEWLKINYDNILFILFNDKSLRSSAEESSALRPEESSALNREISYNRQILKRKRTKNIVATGVATDKNNKYQPIANELKQIVQSQKNININGQKLNGWANSIRLLVESDNVSLDRIEKAVEWYKYHHSDEYVPIIESGKSLREKFTRLEDAIKRNKKPLNGNKKTGYKKGVLNYKEAEEI